MTIILREVKRYRILFVDAFSGCCISRFAKRKSDLEGLDLCFFTTYNVKAFNLIVFEVAVIDRSLGVCVCD
jgi:hypothetical protein